MTPEELLKYELTGLAEWSSMRWLSSFFAWYYSKKVNRKWKRYQHRIRREKWLREKGLII